MPNLVEPVSTVVVVAGGERPDPRTAALVPAGARIIAADSGADHALRLGLRVDELIGDLDSVSPHALARVETEGGSVTRFPSAKDFTDLELALQSAAARRPDRIIVIGGHGGRADHHLAGLLTLASPWLAPAAVTAWHGNTLLSVVRAGTALPLRGTTGSLVTLVPVGGRPVDGVTTTGLAYPLRYESLAIGTTRGVSNELLGPEGSVITRAGMLFALQPDALSHALTLASAPPFPEDPR